MEQKFVLTLIGLPLCSHLVEEIGKQSDVTLKHNSSKKMVPCSGNCYVKSSVNSSFTAMKLIVVYFAQV